MSLLRECPIHGKWQFLLPEAAASFDLAHCDCRWPTSTRRFPPKSRKRLAL